MENACVGYAAAILGNAKDRNWDESMADAMEIDEDCMREFFGAPRYGIKPGKVEEFIQPIADLQELATADDSDSIVLCYSVILRHFPTFSVDLLAPIIESHPCITEQEDKRDILRQCTELYEAAQMYQKEQIETQAGSLMERIGKRAGMAKPIRQLAQPSHSAASGPLMAGAAAMKWRKKTSKH
eukprot:scaffold1006_cov408-Prasinococcus_capsulatus_cf.AAC.18